jgi:D-arabinitol dehydrogenase (NADP+)
MDILDLRPGSDVLVFGAGPSGLLLTQLLVHGGAARVTVAAPTAFKLDLARGYGADAAVQIDRTDPGAARDVLGRLAPEGFDVVVDATGSAAVVAQCTSLARAGGTVFIYGMCDEQASVPLHPYEVFRRQLTIKGSFAQTHCFERALRALRSGRVQTEGIISKEFALEEYEQGLDALRNDPSCLKAAIRP